MAKIKGAKRGGFRIRKFKYARTKSPGWMVTGTTMAGERVREKFSDEALAGNRLHDLIAEAQNTVLSTTVRSTWLSDAQVREAESVFQSIDGKGHTLTFMKDWFSKNYKPALHQKTVKEAFGEFIAAKKKANRRGKTLKNLGHRVGFLVKEHGEKHVSEVSVEDIEVIVHAPNLVPRTQLNRRLALGNFLRWCVKRKYCVENAAAQVEEIKVARKRPKILNLQEVRALIDAAATYKDGLFLTYHVLCLFAALRPTEVDAIGWDAIDLEEKTITVDGDQSKIPFPRHMEIPDNVVAWLRVCKAKKLPLKPRKNFDKGSRAVREMAGFMIESRKAKLAKRLAKKGEEMPVYKDWIKDGMRHTGLSNYFAVHQNEYLTAAWGGNSPTVFKKFYKGLVTQKHAEEFWSIKPAGGDGDKILNMPAPAPTPSTVEVFQTA